MHVLGIGPTGKCPNVILITENKYILHPLLEVNSFISQHKCYITQWQGYFSFINILGIKNKRYIEIMFYYLLSV